MSVIQLNEQNFHQIVQSEKPVLVDFWAPWCGPCRMIAPVLQEVEREVGDQAAVAKLNVDENQHIAMQYGVRSIPTLMVFKKGRVVDATMGLQSKSALKALLLKHA